MLNHYRTRLTAFRLMLPLGLLPLAVIGITRPASAQAQIAPAPVPEVTVQGVGEVTVRPDLARIELSVTTDNKDSAVAVRENAARIDAVLKAIRAVGIDEKDIRTVGFNLTQRYDYQRNVLLGYQVTNSVRVTVRRLTDTGKVIDAATKAGANGGGNVQLELNEADAKKAAEEALAKAVTDAERKARIMARAAKITRLRVLAIVEGGVNNGDPRPLMNARFAAMDANVATPIQAGEQKITASVTVRYTYTLDEAPVLQ